MSRSVNKVILIGHLGKDAETRFTQSGTAVTTWSMATSRRWKDQQSGEWKEETEWHKCVLWRSENVGQYLQRGKQVYVEGRLQTRSYDGNDGVKRYITEVIVSDLVLMATPGANRAPMPEEPAGGAPSGPTITDDDVPF